MVDEINTARPQYDWQTPKPQFDVGRVLANAFKGLFANPSVLIIALVIVVILNVVSTAITTSLMSSAMGPDIVKEGSITGSFWAVSLLTNILLFLSFIWFQLVILQITHNQIFDIPNDVSEILIKALRLCVPMIFLAFLYALVCIVGFYALFIGFAFVWPGWALIGPVFLYEKETSYFGSFSRSWALTRRYKRWIFLILLIVSIIALIIVTLTTSMMIPLFNFNVLNPESVTNMTQVSWRFILYSIISSIGGFFCYGLYASAITASYVELKTIRGETGEHIASVFD